MSSGKGKQPKRPLPARRKSSENYILDPLLVPRIQQFSLNNDIKNVDDVCSYLSETYREYLRKQQGPFRRQVTRGIQIVLKKQSVESLESKLEDRENDHVSKRSDMADNDSDSDNSDSDDIEQGPSKKKKRKRSFKGEYSDSEDEKIEIDSFSNEDLTGTPNILNSSLRLTYDKRPSLRLEQGSPPVDLFHTPNQKAMATLESSSPLLQNNEGESLPAFSSIEMVKMAAKRALRAARTPNGGNNVDEEGMEVGKPTSGVSADAKKTKSLEKSSNSGKKPANPQSKERRDRTSEQLDALTAPRGVFFSDFGGIDHTLQEIRELIEYPLCHPEVYEWLGAEPPRGVLLHGPPGCGKTMLANAIAQETGVPFLKISAPEVVSGMSGESEAKVRSLFADAVRLAPSIIFIDEIDAIATKRENAQREMERRIVAQLLTSMDDLNQLGTATTDLSEGGAITKGHVVVIGATNRPDSLDPALRRAGRFDREISLGIPDEQARQRILEVISKRLRLEGSFDYKKIARKTPGFVGADLQALTKEAAAIAVKRIFTEKVPSSMNGILISSESKESQLPVEGKNGGTEVQTISMEDSERNLDWKRRWGPSDLQDLSITMADFETALPKVQPSAKREGFATIPDVTWEDVGALTDIREELEFSISRPIKFPEEYESMGLQMSVGILLYGPPGCGKTLVAKAIAADAGANFISIKGPELLNKFVGESERAVRQLFSRARASNPCVLFFDEMDAMAPKRGSDGNQAAERVVNQLLTEMDGLDSRKSIFIIAATNRPDMLDPALLRPGRLDKLLFVPLPDASGRSSIARTLVRGKAVAADVDVASLAGSDSCRGFSGADLAALVREACVEALRERIASSLQGTSAAMPAGSPPLVQLRHFESALKKVQPSVSEQDVKRYENLRRQLRKSRGHIGGAEGEGKSVAG